MQWHAFFLMHAMLLQLRYESMAGPQRHFCSLIPAIGLLLAARTSDMRRSAKERAQYEKLLTSLNARLATTAGLTADWGSESRLLIGLFDVDWHDPAATSNQVSEWKSNARKLFGQGHILQETSEGQTMTQLAIEGLMNTPSVQYGDGRVHHFWTAGAKKESMDVMQSMSVVYTTASDRLEAEFPKGSLLLGICSWH